MDKDIFKEEASLPIGSEATLKNEADWPSDDSKDDDYDPEMRENGGGSSSNVSGGGIGDNDGESISTSLSLSSDGVALSTGSWEGHGFSNMVEQCETSNEETLCGPRKRRTVDYTKLYYVSTTSMVFKIPTMLVCYSLLLMIVLVVNFRVFIYLSGNVWKGCSFARAR